MYIACWAENQTPSCGVIARCRIELFHSHRQVFIFTKAKILYTQKRYAAATQLFHQLAASKIRSAPGGTTKEEARYFEALSLAKSGKVSAAKLIWQQLP